jgi:putative acyl-CoA dehydrogenase
MAVTMRLARAYEAPDSDEQEVAFRRLGLAVAKYWVCKRGAPYAAEALECLGGNGYIETAEAPVAQFYRDIQIGTVWEGSGNVIALDVLRAMARSPECVPAFMAEVETASGADPRFDAHLERVRASLSALGDGDPQWMARRLIEDLALAFQGSLLLRDAPPAIADAFCARLAEGRRAFGTLPSSVDADTILERALTT